MYSSFSMPKTWKEKGNYNAMFLIRHWWLENSTYIRQNSPLLWQWGWFLVYWLICSNYPCYVVCPHMVFAWKDEYVRNKHLGQVTVPNINNKYDFLKSHGIVQFSILLGLLSGLAYVNTSSCNHSKSYLLVFSVLLRVWDNITNCITNSPLPSGLKWKHVRVPKSNLVKTIKDTPFIAT